MNALGVQGIAGKPLIIAEPKLPHARRFAYDAGTERGNYPKGVLCKRFVLSQIIAPPSSACEDSLSLRVGVVTHRFLD